MASTPAWRQARPPAAPMPGCPYGAPPNYRGPICSLGLWSKPLFNIFLRELRIEKKFRGSNHKGKEWMGGVVAFQGGNEEQGPCLAGWAQAGADGWTPLTCRRPSTPHVPWRFLLRSVAAGYRADDLAGLRWSMMMTQATPTPAEPVPMEVTCLAINGEHDSGVCQGGVGVCAMGR